MNHKTEPALSAEEWMEYRSDDEMSDPVAYFHGLHGTPAAIAIANDLLPDSDRRRP